MAGLFFHEKHRQKHRDGGQCAGQHGPPDLAGSLNGSSLAVYSSPPVGVDVFQHNDGVVDQHADGKGHARQADDVEGPAEDREQQEGADDADGNRHGNNQCRTDRPQEQQQRHDGEQAANDNVVLHQPDR